LDLWLRRQQNYCGLHLDELLEAEGAAFAADARLLVAAEGRQGVEAAAVDVDLAGTQFWATSMACSFVPAQTPPERP
jgi:hypothetical protein